MKPFFTISTPRGTRTIGEGHPAFIVAEMSGNHHLNFDKAVEIIKAAAAAGADAIKIQTYTPDTMTIDCDKPYFYVKGKDQPDLWKGQKLYDLYKTAYTPWEWDEKLQTIANDLGLVFFSTPFDMTAVDFLEKLNMPCYKIASYEATDTMLLRKVAATGKPIIISVGFATLAEVIEAVATLREYGAKDIAVLHCVTAYSGNPNNSEINLRTMLDIRDRFNIVPGFSDNNGGVAIPVLAAAMGAAIIEKHIVIERTEGGPDARFSVEPNEFAEIVTRIRANEIIMGTVNYGSQGQQEGENTYFRRSLFAVKDIKAGEQFTPENVRSIRPSLGLPTKNYDDIIKSTARVGIERGTPLSWELVSKV